MAKIDDSRIEKMDTTLNGIHILIAEDDESFKDSIGFFLTSLGATVEFASDGVEAISKANQGCFDLVFMDLTLPKLDGESAVRALRSEAFATPIIAMSAHSASSRQGRCMEAGFSDYLAKPFGLDEIIQKIETHLLKDEGKKTAQKV